MPLDFGGSLFGGDEATGLNTPKADQFLFAIKYDIVAGTTWETIKTVSQGKKAYVTQVIFYHPTTGTSAGRIGSNSTADLEVGLVADGTTIISLTTPLEYKSGTIIQVYCDNAADIVSINGWEE